MGGRSRIADWAIAAVVLGVSAPGCASSERDGGPRITLTTVVPTSTATPGGKTNATWAAYLGKEGAWVKLEPTDVGTYSFESAGDRWTAVFACANADNALVAIHSEPINAAVLGLEIPLESWCATTPPDAYTLSGTLSNLVDGVSWLDFGYALESRGAVLPANGTSAAYEEVNVAAGTWDLAFGVRTDSAGPLAKIALVRAQSMTTDATLDIDLAGPSAVVPETRRLVVHGLDPAAETLALPVHYTMNGGKRGIDLGPQNVPLSADVDVTYAAVPALAQAPTDGYRMELTATAELEGSLDVRSRGAVVTLHAPADVDFALVPPLDPPSLSFLAERPHVRVEAKTTARQAAARYELSVLAKITNRETRTWRVATSAALVTTPDAVIAMPDLTTAPGFDAAWSIPADVRRDVEVKITDMPEPIGDGKREAFVAYTTKVRL
jgi:hypothetical protein